MSVPTFKTPDNVWLVEVVELDGVECFRATVFGFSPCAGYGDAYPTTVEGLREQGCPIEELVEVTV